MLRACVSVLLAGCLAACTVLADRAAPDRISLNGGEVLRVHFTDGSACSANIVSAPKGVFSDCPQAMDYDVTLAHRSIVGKTVLSPFFEPYATIRLVRPFDGRSWTWFTPRDRNEKGEADPLLLINS